MSELLRPEPCPWLPEIDQLYDFSVTRRHGRDRGIAYYMDALRYAQSRWLSGKPAQAILQVNKAFMADVREGDWLSGVDPYRAMVWMMVEADANELGFMGNPVRHFQHLASRMSGVRADARSWRAWMCMHLAERYLPGMAYPRDGVQMVREGLWVPSVARVLAGLVEHGWDEEAELVSGLMGEL